MNRRSMRTLILAACAVMGALATTAAADSVTVCFYSPSGLLLAERTVPPGTAPLEAALVALVAGPTAEERAAGATSAIPEGTSVVKVEPAGTELIVDLSPDVLAGLDEAALLSIFQQFRATLMPFEEIDSFRLTCRDTLLSAYLPPAPSLGVPAPALKAPSGAQAAAVGLSGRNISFGPSHGRYWNGSGWYYQRPQTCGLGEAIQEDLNSIRLGQFLHQYLVQDGATVHIPRELNESNCCHSAEGLAWWRMAARYWLQANGIPSWVWDSSTTDLNDDIRARPLYADYRGSEIYVSCHTNAFDGTASGTEVYYDAAMEHPEHVAASQTLADNVKDWIEAAIRDMYDGTWPIRNGGNPRNANGAYGEIRIPDRPACLIELAFHDNCTKDALYLVDNYFRSVAEWGLYRGICEYFGATPTWDKYSDEYVSDTIPATMTATQSYNVSITFRNRGVLWTTARGFRLGAVGDSDPFTAFNRVDISGEVRPGATYTFNFTMTAPATPGTYTTDWRMVRDGVAWFGATHSEPVTVVGGGSAPPAITQHPTNQTIPPFGTATFTVAAVGDPPLSYQWQKNGGNLTDGGKISGATSTTLQIVNADAGDEAAYRCVVTNPYGSAPSNSATLTLAPTVYIVESRSGGQNFAKYSDSGFADSGGKSTAPGVTPGIGSRYGSTYRSVAGEKHANFDADLVVAGPYEVFATWGANANRRSPILHRITHAGGTSDVNVDQAATANVWVSLGTYNFNAGTNVGRVDVNNLNIDVSGSMYADAVKWEYRGAPQPPTITQHPTPQSVCPGATAAFTVSATGSGTLTYQWQKDGVNLSEGGHYSGVFTATLTVSNADAGDAANYRCVVTNAGGNTNSNAAALGLKAATTITQHPQPQHVARGGPATFSIAASGAGTLTYQWKKDGANLINGGNISGADTAVLTVNPAGTPDAGNYSCEVSADCGGMESNAAALTLSAYGDLDLDGDVDLADFGAFQDCFNGPNRPYAQGGCAATDWDADDDVDLTDFGQFQVCFNGPNRPPACS